MAANECGFDDLKQMEKTALTQSSKTYTNFDFKLIQGNILSTNNLLNAFSPLYSRITTKSARNFKNVIESYMRPFPTMYIFSC